MVVLYVTPFQGCFYIFPLIPGRCPGLGMSRPFRAPLHSFIHVHPVRRGSFPPCLRVRPLSSTVVPLLRVSLSQSAPICVICGFFLRLFLSWRPPRRLGGSPLLSLISCYSTLKRQLVSFPQMRGAKDEAV